MHPRIWVGKSFVLLLLLLPTVAGANPLRITVARVESGSVTARDLALQLLWGPDQVEGALRMTMGVLDWPAAGQRLRNVVWECTLRRGEATGDWHCSGPLRAAGYGRGTLQLQVFADGWRGELASGKARLLVSGPAGSADADARSMQLTAKQLPLEWLQPLLAAVWPEGRLTAGQLAADIELKLHADHTALGGSLQLDGLGLDSDDGRIAMAGLQAGGSLAAEVGNRWALDLDLKLRGGELLAVPLYVELPSSAIDFSLRAQSATGGGFEVPSLRWGDAEVLRLDASLAPGTATESIPGSYELSLASEDLDQLQRRYGQSLLAAAGMPGAQMDGKLQAQLGGDARGLLHGSVDAEALDFDSGDGRVRVEGMQGVLRWARASEAQHSRLGWSALELYGIPLAAAELQAISASGGLRLGAPLRVATLGGALSLERLSWRPAGDAAGESQLELALQLDDIALADLSTRLGWPSFSGSLGGRVPSARYADGTLTLEGGLQIAVFDGEVRVGALQIERPFGVAPTLSADLQMSELDLQPLTAVFGFGDISGRLQGSINGLRLVDWEPVAFDARFNTVERRGVPRRISQRAVNDLSRVGGGGLVAGLQSQALRFFDSFGYARIGLGCRLRNHVCEMSGIEGESGSAGGGYTVVEGAGLPRITVNGHQRRVDWPVLVARLQAVSEGQSPRVE